jgi:GH18 family chitinase
LNGFSIDLSNNTEIEQNAKQQNDIAKKFHFDGLNIDYENVIDKNDLKKRKRKWLLFVGDFIFLL